VKLRVGTWNLREGGVEDGDDRRLLQQLDLLTGADVEPVDAWLFQEAQHWDTDGHRLLHLAARRLGMSARVLIPSAHHGCHLAMLVREHPGLRVVRERHDRAAPWWHALGHLELDAEGKTVHLLNLHLAPTAPAVRLLEAETLGLFRSWRVIAAGDYNAHPLGPLPDPATIPDHDKAHRKLDQRAAHAVQAAGFADVGATLGDTTPTVGHDEPGALAYRCDRVQCATRRCHLPGGGEIPPPLNCRGS
jgi:hypothetical protein